MHLKTTLFSLAGILLSGTLFAGNLTHTFKGVAISTEHTSVWVYDESGVEVENTTNLPAGTYRYKAVVNKEGIGDIEELGTIDYCYKPGTFIMPEGDYNLEVDFSDFVPVEFSVSENTFPCFTFVYDANNNVAGGIGGEDGLSGNFTLYCLPGSYTAEFLPLEKGYKLSSNPFTARTNASPVNVLLEQDNIYHVIVMVTEPSERPINGATVKLSGYPAVVTRYDLPFSYVPNVSENSALPVEVSCPGYKTVNTTVNVSDAGADPDIYNFIPLLVIMEKGPQGVTAQETGRVNAYGQNGNIMLTGVQPGEDIKIYDLTGHLIVSCKAGDTTGQYPVAQKGIYFVNADNTTLKVVVL